VFQLVRCSSISPAPGAAWPRENWGGGYSETPPWSVGWPPPMPPTALPPPNSASVKRWIRRLRN